MGEASGGLGILTSAAGTLMGSNAERAQGHAAQVAANNQALQMRQQANNALATSTFEGINDQKQKDQVIGRAQADAGANGVVGTSVTNLIGNLEQQGDYRTAVDQYEGQTKAQSENYGADLTQFEGEQTDKADNRAANGMLISGAANTLQQGSSLYARYATPGSSSGPNFGSSSTIQGGAAPGVAWNNIGGF
jgi:hypothetical protein